MKLHVLPVTSINPEIAVRGKCLGCGGESWVCWCNYNANNCFINFM